MAKTDSMLAHMVYFALKDRTAEGIARQLEACRKYLTGHEGTIFFAVGTRTPDLSREVNDREFDVGLHVVFRSRAAHDAYQTHPRHVQFIEENKAHWAKVRVFDSDAE
jgi:Stress responsive A/B Barrel Domain